MIDIRKNDAYKIDIYLKITNEEDTTTHEIIRTTHEIVQEHISVTNSNPKGYTWWGNNQPFTPAKLHEFIKYGHNPQVLIVIPKSAGGSNDIAYVADIMDAVKSKEGGFPPDGWRPKYYFNRFSKIWLKLSNFKRVSAEDNRSINQYFLVKNNQALSQKISTSYSCGYVYKLKSNKVLNDDDLKNKVEELIGQLQTVTNSIGYSGTPKEKKSLINDGNGSSKYPRDPKIASNALTIAKHKCEFDFAHKTFMRKSTGTQYMEAHHLIPLSEHSDFIHSLDVEENICSLCSNCHNCLHYGTDEEKIEVLTKLYKDRKALLVSVNLDITFSSLKKFYDIR